MNAPACVPQAYQPALLLLTEKEPVIGVQHDDRVLRVRARVQGVEQPPDLLVGPTDTGQVRLHGLPPVVAVDEPLMRRSGGSNTTSRRSLECHCDRRRETEGVRPSRAGCRRNSTLGVERNMRPIKSDRQQEWAVLCAIVLPDDVDAPGRVFVILKQFLVVSLPAEVPQSAGSVLCQRNQSGIAFQTLPWSRPDDVEIAIRQTRCDKSHWSVSPVAELPAKCKQRDSVFECRHSRASAEGS